MKNSMKKFNEFILEKDIKNPPTINLLEKLYGLGFNFLIHTHPPLRTVEEAKKYRRTTHGGNAKNLFLRDKKKNNFLITVDENQPIDLKSLANLICSDRLSFASPKRLLEFLGVLPGAVSPLALINDTKNNVSFFIDENLIKEEKINFHPLINNLTITIDTKDFSKFLDSIQHSAKYLKFE
tara:strand:- start:501 stop:1043 length:543 start_codon:yes stop_codon:yes gene_type:complete